MNEILQQLDTNLNLLSSIQEDNRVTVVFKLETKSAVCPFCGHLSHRPHSSYTRVVHDLPIYDQEVTLIIQL
jgi:transposase